MRLCMIRIDAQCFHKVTLCFRVIGEDGSQIIVRTFVPWPQAVYVCVWLKQEMNRKECHSIVHQGSCDDVKSDNNGIRLHDA